MEIFVNDAGKKAGKWRRVLVNASICLLASHSLPNVIFTFTPFGLVLKMHEDIKWHNVISKFKAMYIIF